jgi:uncharacterized protein YjbI with pentapeptide repeats
MDQAPVTKEIAMCRIPFSWYPVFCLGCLLVLVTAAPARADIFRWDNDQVIPGTEGITPGPGVQLDHRDLQFARLSDLNLADSQFAYSDLTSAVLKRSVLISANLTGASLTGANMEGAVVARADFGGTTPNGFTKEQLYSTASYALKDLHGIGLSGNDCTGWDFSRQNLSSAILSGSTLTTTDFTDAVLTGATLRNTIGFAKEQLYSTASYQTKNLRGIRFGGGEDRREDLRGWDFSGQDLTGARFWVGKPTTVSLGSDLTNANLSHTNLTDASLDFTVLIGADLTGAVVTTASFRNATSTGFTKQQLYSTASYQAQNLQGIGLEGSDLSGWDFSGQNLANANLRSSKLTNANLTGAVVTGIDFFDTTHQGFTRDQLYSTASYRAKNLQGIGLEGSDLSGWDFSGQNLTGANLGDSTLVNANLSGAVVTAAILRSTTSSGFTQSQLASTASYHAKNLQGIDLSFNNLTGWDFREQNLRNANLELSILKNANLTGTNINGARLAGTTSGGFTKEQLYSTASYKEHNLKAISFRDNDLSGWDFRGKNVVHADFSSSNLTRADFSFADLRGAYFDERADVAILRNAILPGGNIKALTLSAGETLVANPGVPVVVQLTGSISIAPGASFDLTDNAAIVDYTEASPIAIVRERILSGRGGPGIGGLWTGTGITSSTAAAANQTAPDSRSLGYAENATLPLGAYTIFHGAPVDSTSILIAFTRTGDANLDGVVNDDDVTIIGASYAPGVSQGSWALGDFDYNGFVDDDDVTLLGVFYDPAASPVSVPLANLSSSVPSSNVVAVPEPSTLVLCLIAGCAAALWVAAHHHRRRSRV